MVAEVEEQRLDRWLRRVRGTAEVVSIVALCSAVALLVIGFIPGSAVRLPLPTHLLPASSAGGVVPGVVVDPSGDVVFKVTDPSLAQRLLYLLTTLPALVLVAEIARRVAKILRAAQDDDPFTARTARALTVVAKITAVAGLGVWVVGTVAKWALSGTMLRSGTSLASSQTPLAWFAVALIFAAFAQLIARGVAMRAELDAVI